MHEADAIDERVAILSQIRALEDEKRRRTARAQHHAQERATQRAREDAAVFLETVIKDAYTGQPIKLAEIHRTWLDHINYCWQRGLHAIILAPFGHGKTSIILGIILFLLGRNPNLRIKLVCADDTAAVDRLGAIKKYIEFDPDYRRVFPGTRRDQTGPWSQTTIRVQKTTISKDETVKALGINTGNMGSRSDLNIFDDICDRRNMIEQPALRDKVFGGFVSTFQSRLEEGRLSVAIMTRWHEQDVPGRIMADPEMRRAYGILIQRINADFTGIDCTYYYGDAFEDTESSYATTLRLAAAGAFDHAEAPGRAVEEAADGIG